MPSYDPHGRITFSKEEREQLQAQAAAAGITLAQQVKLLLVRGLEVVDDKGDRYVVGVDLSRLDQQVDTPGDHGGGGDRQETDGPGRE